MIGKKGRKIQDFLLVEACGSSEEFVAGAGDSSHGATESGRSNIHGLPSDAGTPLTMAL